MTSQTWLTTDEVDQPVWKHWMIVTVPDEVKTSTGLLVHLGRSATASNPPNKVDPLTSQLALGSNSVVTELKMIPNQPLVFNGEKRKRQGRLDDRLYVGQVPAHRRPEVAGPAADDQGRGAGDGHDHRHFAPANEGGKLEVDKFMVCGGSKRGWTTWTTACRRRAAWWPSCRS